MVHRVIRSARAGFSLLEVLVVVAILSVAAYVAIDAVDHDTSQMRYELTETRLAAIRRAIVGDPSLTVNGSPMISGYVADVGQLPPCLEALFEPDVDCNPNIVSDDIILPLYADFSGSDGTDTAGAYFDADSTLNFSDGDIVLLAAGWRGPYIKGSLTNFDDAWGNAARGSSYATTATEDFVENGWNVSTASNTFNVTTLGRNRSIGTEADPSIYDEDSSIDAIGSQDWQVDLDGMSLSIRLMNSTSSEAAFDLCIGVIHPSQTSPSEWTVSAGQVAGTVPAGDSLTATHTFPPDTTVTAGQRGFVVFDPDPTGICDIPGTDNPRFEPRVRGNRSFLLLPRHALNVPPLPITIPFP
ncbi:MAG: prepilin-type N-terminal cleavage/methylation domain-containing protein [Pseudomonadota bacterium]